MAEDLFEKEILIDDEGNVIEEGSASEKDTDKEKKLESNEYEVDDQGRLLDENGKLIENTEEDTGDKNEPASASSTTNTLPPFAKALKEAGVLPDLEFENDEDYTAENLINAVRNQIKKSEFSDLNKEQKELLEIMRSGGDVGKYLEYHHTGTQAKERFKEITEDNAEDFTRQYYKLKGLSNEEIDDIIDERTINSSLKEKAEKLKDSYDSIIEQKKQEQVELSKQKQQELEQQAQETLQNYRKTIDSTDEFIKGHKLSKDIKDKIYELGTKPVSDKQGNQMTALQKFISDDPIQAEAKLNYLYLITDGFTKMDNITYSKTAKSTAVRELQERLEQEQQSRQGGSSPKLGGKNNKKPSILDAKF